MSKLFEYFRSLIRANTLESSKSFGLLCSMLTGSLVWDVCTNGFIKTNLDSLGWFVSGIGVYMAGGSLPKTISDVSSRKKIVEEQIKNK